MATRILGTDHPVLLPRPVEARDDAECGAQEVKGGAIRGFFYAMIFNILLFFTGAAGWELWRLMR